MIEATLKLEDNQDGDPVEIRLIITAEVAGNLLSYLERNGRSRAEIEKTDKELSQKANDMLDADGKQAAKEHLYPFENRYTQPLSSWYCMFCDKPYLFRYTTTGVCPACCATRWKTPGGNANPPVVLTVAEKRQLNIKDEN